MTRLEYLQIKSQITAPLDNQKGRFYVQAFAFLILSFHSLLAYNFSFFGKIHEGVFILTSFVFFVLFFFFIRLSSLVHKREEDLQKSLHRMFKSGVEIEQALADISIEIQVMKHPY